MSLKLFSKFSKKFKSLTYNCRNLKPPVICNSSTYIINSDEKFLEVFNHLDRNGDGKISIEELRLLLNSTTTTTTLSAETIIRDFDADGDGLMDYEDFKKLINGGGNNGVGDDDEQLKVVFEEFEGEKGSGYITARGLQRVMKEFFGEEKTSEECETMIRAYDLDGNGVLDYHEFQRMMSMP